MFITKIPIFRKLIDKVVKCTPSCKLPLNGVWIAEMSIRDYIKQSHENEILDFLQKYSQDKKLQTVLDIGAHVGYFSLHFSKYADRVISFEPDKVAHAALVKNTKRAKHIEVKNIAVSNTVGTQSLYADSLGLGHSSLLPIKNFEEQTIVDVCTIDSFNFEQVDLMKIDVEGNELHVLQGAVSTIQKSKPTIILEISEKINKNIQEIFTFFEREGYACESLLEKKAHQNYVCRPKY